MINLSIINPLSCVAEPPSSVTIIDYSGTAVEDTAGPYQLDTILTLTCVSSGGRGRHTIISFNYKPFSDLSSRGHQNRKFAPTLKGCYQTIKIFLSCQ